MNNEKLIKFRKKVERSNKVASFVISFGGYGVILSILLILLFLIYESLPLSFSASIKEIFVEQVKQDSIKSVAVGTDRYMEIEYVLYDNGLVEFYSLEKDVLLLSEEIDLQDGEKIVAGSKGSNSKEIISLATNHSRIIVIEVKMKPEYHKGVRTIVPSLRYESEFSIPNDSTKYDEVAELEYSVNEYGSEYWAWRSLEGKVFVRVYDYDEDEIYEKEISEEYVNWQPGSMTLSEQGEHLIIGTKVGEMFWFDLSDPEDIKLKDNWKASHAEITALNFLIGDNSLIIGDADGRVQRWFPVRTVEGIFRFNRIHENNAHNSAIKKIIVSPRNRSFITLDTNGECILHYGTTNQVEAEFKPFTNGIESISFSPKANGLIILDSQHNLGKFKIENEHPETTLNTLFGKVWYEGYDSPEFVWQSTGGSGEFEPKFSLIPLIFGTFKGTLYAMLFSVPLAILSAIYISQFAPKKFAQIIKPTIEIMAALPSVVVGFLAGLYFSPLFEKYLVSFFLILITVPVFFVIAIIFWRMIPEEKRVAFPAGTEIVYMIPFLILAVLLVSAISNPVELYVFEGNLNQWIFENLGSTYDQRNSLVVGFALGFAVIPIIFTISEDALSNVPKSLTSASLALGASRWQTVLRVVLPAAAAGIFAASMLGLGRAIGETMIVLMATGNTPLMDLSPFNGFRAMSATIAVEIPEAPVDGTLYRILFLTALLLFLFTFIINSISAWISDRLRKKYARF